MYFTAICIASLTLIHDASSTSGEEATKQLRLKYRPREGRQLFRDDAELAHDSSLQGAEDPQGIGQFPLGPRPEYDNPDFEPVQDDQMQNADTIQFENISQDAVDENQLYDLSAFTSPDISTDPGAHYDEGRYEGEHSAPEYDYTDEPQEEEHRSPTHRYSDETPQHNDVKNSLQEYTQSTQYTQSTPSEDFVTPTPFRTESFSPFSSPAEATQPSSAEQQDSTQRLSLQQDSEAEQSLRRSRPTLSLRKRTSAVNRRIAQVGVQHERPQFSRHPASRNSDNLGFSESRNRLHKQRQQGGYPAQHEYQPQDQYQLQEPQQHLEEQYADYPDYEEEEEPDRLSELLVVSSFKCAGLKDGYYADESVDCEVFHVCQDGVKHSWLCPNEGAFHQVHLICMPRSEDNICERSSKYHFVNDFLYKEVGDHPENKTYVERYYPQGYEGGVANIPEEADGLPPPQAVQPQSYYNDDHLNQAYPPAAYSTKEPHPVRQQHIQPRHPSQQKRHTFNPRHQTPESDLQYIRPSPQPVIQQEKNFNENDDQLRFGSEPESFFQERMPPSVDESHSFRPFQPSQGDQQSEVPQFSNYQNSEQSAQLFGAQQDDLPYSDGPFAHVQHKRPTPNLNSPRFRVKRNPQYRYLDAFDNSRSERSNPIRRIRRKIVVP